MENDNKKLEKLSNLKEFEEFYLFLRENGYEGTKEQFTKELVEILNEDKLIPAEESELDCVAGGNNFKANVSKALSVGMASLLAISSSPLQLEVHASNPNGSSSLSKKLSLSPDTKEALSKASVMAAPAAILGIPVVLATTILADSSRDSRVSKTEKNPSVPSKVQGVVSEKIVKDLSEATRVLMDFGDTFGVNNRVLNDETLDEIHLLAENTLGRSTGDFNLVEVLQWLAKLNELTERVEESCETLYLDEKGNGELTYIENTIDSVCSSLGVNKDQLGNFGKDEVAQEELRNLREDLKQSQDREKRTQEELNKSKQNVISYEQTLKELKNELKVAEQKMQETAQNLQKIKDDQRSRTQSELIEAQNRYQESETKCAQLRDKIEELEESDKFSKETIQNLETQLKSEKESNNNTTTELKKIKEEIKESHEKSQEQTQSLTSPVMDVVAEQSSQAQTEQAQAVSEINLSKNMIKFIDNYGKYFNLNKENCKVKLNKKEMSTLRNLAHNVRTQFKEIENMDEHVFTETYKDCVPENFEQCLKMLCQRIADTLHYHCCEMGVWKGTNQKEEDIASKVAPLCGVNMEYNRSTGDHRNMRDVFKNNSLDMWVLATFLRAKSCERYKTPTAVPIVDEDKEEYAEYLGNQALKCIDMIQAVAKQERKTLPYLEKVKRYDENGEFDLLFEKFIENTEYVRPVVVGTEEGVELFLSFNRSLSGYLRKILNKYYDLSDKYLLLDSMNGASWQVMFNYLNLQKKSEINDEYGIVMSVRRRNNEHVRYCLTSRFAYDKETGKMVPAAFSKGQGEEGEPVYYKSLDTMGRKEVQEKDQNVGKENEPSLEQNSSKGTQTQLKQQSSQKHNPKKRNTTKKAKSQKSKKRYWT